ncbi:hypothetical protein [Acidiphilium rubrum]|uniref:hypothetical protein n=1 Tax=Acidiphilium rubrum TaxID=526 RepID=UPI002BA0F6C8|nr:hypothetical protein [Acidiphilium rubrum]HQT86803.1 hypothetical protein [Acidiphilium rubrum]
MIDQRETLAELAARVQRLAPDRRDPERYYCEKSEIAAALRRLARDFDQSSKIIPNNTGRNRTV